MGKYKYGYDYKYDYGYSYGYNKDFPSVWETNTNTNEYTSLVSKRTKAQEEALQRIKKTMLLSRNKFVCSVAEANADTEQKNIYFPAKGGIYIKSTMHIGGNVVQVIEKAKECALLEEVTEGIKEVTINNKIPADLIKEIIGSFNIIYKDSGDEAAAQIYKKRNTDEYFIYYPEQKISKASVSYPDDPNVQTLRTENELVCELHSHNSMSAFWSGTDDANENEICFYVVLGTFNNDVTYKARVKCNSFQKDLKLSDIFSLTEEEEKDMLKKENIGPGNPEIKIKVTKNTPTVTTSTSTSTALTDPYYEYTAAYYRKINKYNNKNKKKEGRLKNVNLIDDKKNMLEGMEVGTINYLDNMAFEYNASNINSSDIIRFFDSRNLEDIKDDLGVVDCADYTDGYNLFNIYDDEALTKNIDARAHAFLLKSYLTASSYDLSEESDIFDELYTPEGFTGIALNLRDTNVTTINWSLITFWEMLNKYQKALIANVFDQNILFISQFVHSKEETNYYFIDFLAHIVFAPKNVRQRYIDFVEDVSIHFDTLIDDADTDATQYESLSMLEVYFEKCLEQHVSNNTLLSIDDIVSNSISEAALVNEYSMICSDTDQKIIDIESVRKKEE